MQKSKQTSDKPIYKKWWFWVIIVVVLCVIGLATQSATEKADEGNNSSGDNSQNVGTLPTLNRNDYLGKEGLVVFKDLVAKGYTVKANYVNEAVSAASRDLTEDFTNADENSCSDRLGWDAYIVSNLTQDGDNISLTLNVEPNDNEDCPAGTVNDL